MKLLNKIIPFLTSAAVFVLLEILLFFPKSIYWVVVSALFLVILAIFQITGRFIIKNSFLNLITTPIFLISGGFMFLVFLENVLLRHFIALAIVLLIFAILQSVTLKFNFRHKYQPHSLDNIISHTNSLSVFLISSGFFSFLIFLAVSSGLLFALFGAFIFLITIQLLWFSETSIKSGWPFLFVITVLMVEIFWAVIYLPTSIYVNAMILTLSYYLISGILKNWLLGIRENRVIKRYLIVSAASLIIILATAKWF